MRWRGEESWWKLLSTLKRLGAHGGSASVHYRADVPLGFSDPLHLGQVRYGRASTHRVLVFYLADKYWRIVCRDRRKTQKNRQKYNNTPTEDQQRTMKQRRTNRHSKNKKRIVMIRRMLQISVPEKRRKHFMLEEWFSAFQVFPCYSHSQKYPYTIRWHESHTFSIKASIN